MRFQKGHTLNLGKKRTEEFGKKMSKILKGKHISPKTEFTSERLKKMWQDPKFRENVIRKRSEAQKGRKFSKEHKLKLSLAHKGITTWNKGHRTYLDKICEKCGKKFRIRHWVKKARFCSRKCLEGLSAGKKNYFWKDGKSHEPYSSTWKESLKESIRQRDNHKCQVCGVPQIECIQKLSVHHIDYDKKNDDTKNLISLCRRCHAQTSINRKYWTNYFKDKILT